METLASNFGRVVRGSQPYKSRQGSLYTAAISAETVGAKSLFFGIVEIPAGERTKAHVHQYHESAFYVLSGENIELWSGGELEHREAACPATICSSRRTYPTSPSTVAPPRRSSSERATNRPPRRVWLCAPNSIDVCRE